MTSKSFLVNYWNYYLMLEEQVMSTKRYIDFSVINNGAYSMEFLQLILSIGSEIDVVAKVIAKDKDPSFKGESIKQWGGALDSALPGLQSKTVVFNGDYMVQPWKKWNHTQTSNGGWKLANNCKNPDWWNIYNKVKHQRTDECTKGRTYYTKANLKYVISMLAALRIMESMFLDQLLSQDGVIQDYEKGQLR